jgi:16S rRNA (cytosine967-C5)-methyltransferase
VKSRSPPPPPAGGWIERARVTERASGVSQGRRVAFRILSEVERGRRLDRAFEAEAPRLSIRDRGWVQDLTYGATRFRGQMDHLLDLHLARGMGSLDPSVRVLLRMGAYQILRMGGVPPYAAVSQTVSQVQESGGRGVSGMANAVLRALARAGGGAERFPSFEGDPLGHLERWGSHPAWLLERWCRRVGVEETRRWVEANNRIPSLHLRPLGVDLEEARHRLQAAGWAAVPDGAGSGTLRLPSGTDPVQLLQVLPSLIQDPAAGRVVGWVGPVAGKRVADLCAAPGGKGVGLAALGARVVGLDPSQARLRRMQETVRRLALPVALAVGRGESPPVVPQDVVLVDAPCSGTGTLARHPDARWRLRPETIGVLSALQDQILDGAATIVRPGGLLVYATCSMEEEENRARVRAFLDRHPQFGPENPPGIQGVEGEAGILEVFPHRSGSDGAFAVRLRRQGFDESHAERER